MPNRILNILHVAATIGNIGDDASHMGLREILNETVGKYKLTEINIRKAYSNYSGRDKLKFDQTFVEYMNGYDLCIFGGGAFLDHPVEGSVSGTTIDFPINCLDKIKCRVLFASIGCRPKSACGEAQDKLKYYLGCILNNPRCEILLRNDGSLNYLNQIGFRHDKLLEILDHGFFLNPWELELCGLDKQKYACINVVYDQQSFFGNSAEISEQTYYKVASAYINCLCDYGFQEIYLMPHIYKDLFAISRVMDLLDATTIAEKIIVPKLKQGKDNAKDIFSLYKGSALNLGTRFHMNVCSLALERPTIPFAITQRIKELYASLGGQIEMFEEISSIDDQIVKTLTKPRDDITTTIKEKKEYTIAVYNDLLNCS